MRKIEDINEIKRIELDALIAVDKFCRDNDIIYYLYYGTLIGAIRHKGFIPWDDDIDIAMKREDYNKFISMFSDEKYKLATYQNKDGYIYPFSKVYDSTTLLDEHMLIKCKLGIGLDVFPIDGIETDEKSLKQRVDKITFYKRIISGKMFWLNKISPLKRGIIRCVAFFYDGKKVAKKIDQIGSSVTIDTTERAGVIVFGNPKINFMPKSYFDDVTEVEFEGHKFLAPKRYHDVLTTIFGDYMTPPDSNHRSSDHHFDAWYC